MDLFDETKNKYVISTIELINRVYNGEKINSKDLKKEFCRELEKDELDIGNDYFDSLKDDYGIFKLDNNKTVSLSCDSGIEIRPTLPEKVWLKNALLDEKMRLFLSAITIDQLKSRLEDVKEVDLNENIILKGISNSGDKIDDIFIEKFQKILKAIEEEKVLIYSNKGWDGSEYKNKRAFVYKIEFSIIEQKFRASLWSLDEERPVKANIGRMFDLKLGDKLKKPYNEVKEMLENKRSTKPIEIKIQNKNNTVERALLLFSQYEKKACWENINVLKLEIYFYIFDEIELFRNILSLGPMAEVIAPVEMRQRIIKTINPEKQKNV